MSRPSGSLHRRGPSGHEPTRARRTDAGIARGPGLLVAGVTAAIVFVIGQQLFPIKPKQVPAPAVPAPNVPPPAALADAAPAATSPTADAAPMVAVADAGATAAPADAGKKTIAEQEPGREPEPTKSAAQPPPDDSSTGVSPEHKLADKQTQADRDLAREAWRRNRPDISVVGTKTSILVPIRGSTKGADFKILRKTRTVVVTLPRAVAMITLRVYNLKHPSFKKLWIDQDEANAKPQDGTKLRLSLSQTFDPQVEITDDFVRVTIRRPESAGDSTEKSAESRAEKHREKHREKPPEPSDEGDAAPDKEKD